MLEQLHTTWKEEVAVHLEGLRKAAVANENIFGELMETSKFASIGQITEALFNVGGQYRRNM